MKITLTYKEACALKSIMEDVETGSLNELKKELKDNKIVSYSLKPVDKEVEITINPNYMTDFLEVYDRFIGVLINQGKSLIGTVMLLSEETDKVVRKYAGGDKNA